ncbi:uncharacterized protein PHACADRAFT_258863 [Phanerochaete carnosa HHB-10118-sp]|uniref:DUF6593 domain-containing protein n=1 Tax=Phanerochaete carnosa (strain HHB-10118-sp) TaxID=650164 RepID=K5VTD7_PHACS|nr:uncharacterized protein PHACADRAFT_258863 [Phanerochaete carnosa HHB-10118-sp]EKM54778.1 hypothetical protein PHACADRAFT_258863 [Phanerochaete carnosa HHB-10118-sp]
MPPPPKVQPPHRLELSTNSLRNTAIASADDSIHYEIVTRFWHPHITKINRCDFENLVVDTVAEIERNPGQEPRVRFDGDKGEWVPASQFLNFSEDRIGGTFTGPSDIRYQWRTHKGHLQLVKDADGKQEPVVDFHPHKRHFFAFRMSKHAWLEVKPQPEVTEVMERLIVSYLLVERRRRDAHLRVKIERG